MTDDDYKLLAAKIEREFPIRLQLWELAGKPKINVKNYKALEAFDHTIPELFLIVAINKRENIDAALDLIVTLFS